MRRKAARIITNCPVQIDRPHLLRGQLLSVNAGVDQNACRVCVCANTDIDGYIRDCTELRTLISICVQRCHLKVWSKRLLKGIRSVRGQPDETSGIELPEGCQGAKHAS